MRTNQCNWGGARPGAGRKPREEKTVRVSAFLTEAERDMFKLLGGAKWIQSQIKQFEAGEMTCKIDTTKFTEEQRDLFMQGWKSAGGYTGDLDTGCPWCCPWYCGNCEIEVSGADVKDWGRQHWEACREEIEDYLKEEQS